MQVLHNARIHTFNPYQPTVSALAIDHGRVVAAGSDADLLALSGPGVVVMDMQGKTILPGLTDAHIHIENYALFLQIVDCETPTRDECLRRVAERTQSTPSGAWIRGHGWNQNVWAEGFGNAALLDAIAPEHPVFLTAKSLHAAWANTRAMQLAGIDLHTPDPEGGRIDRAPDGSPTGILFESAMELIYSILPEPGVTEVADAIESAQTMLWSMGITGVHDFDQARCFSALQMLHADERLHLHVIKSIPLELLDHAAALGLRSGFGDDFLRIGSVKMFADGALGPHTAAMLEPYENDPGQTGMLFMDAEQMLEHGQTAVRGGISVAVHAIGDRANHEMLNAFEQIRQYEMAHDLPALRHRIEHVQILHPQDHHRLAELGVIGSVQPIHATSDMDIADQFWGARSANAYAYRTLLQNNTHVAFGSDAPVESPNPFLGIHAAVTRQRTSNYPEGGWYPPQRLSLQEAFHGFTLGPAYAAGMEDRLGSLSPGFHADLIVLPVDPFDIPVDHLHSLAPDATMVSGQWVWRKSA